MSEPEPLRILTTLEVATLAGVTVPTVTRWVLDNRLQPFYKHRGLRGAYLFQSTEVERFLAERKSERSPDEATS